MADKAYVVVANMKVDKTFDNKYKTTLPKIMKTAAEGAIKNSPNMTQKPTNKDAKSYSLDATVTSLAQNGKNLEAKLSMALSEDDHMFGFLNGGGKLPSSGNPKDLDGDVEDLVAGVIKSLIKDKVGPAIQQKMPKTP